MSLLPQPLAVVGPNARFLWWHSSESAASVLSLRGARSRMRLGYESLSVSTRAAHGLLPSGIGVMPRQEPATLPTPRKVVDASGCIRGMFPGLGCTRGRNTFPLSSIHDQLVFGVRTSGAVFVSWREVPFCESTGCCTPRGVCCHELRRFRGWLRDRTHRLRQQGETPSLELVLGGEVWSPSSAIDVEGCFRCLGRSLP